MGSSKKTNVSHRECKEMYEMLYMVICWTKISICDNSIGSMAFCLSPNLIEYYIWSNTHFCEEKELDVSYLSLQTFRTVYIIYKAYNRHMQGLTHLEVFQFKKYSLKKISHWNNIFVTIIYPKVMCNNIWSTDLIYDYIFNFDLCNIF